MEDTLGNVAGTSILFIKLVFTTGCPHGDASWLQPVETVQQFSAEDMAHSMSCVVER